MRWSMYWASCQVSKVMPLARCLGSERWLRGMCACVFPPATNGNVQLHPHLHLHFLRTLNFMQTSNPATWTPSGFRLPAPQAGPGDLIKMNHQVAVMALEKQQKKYFFTVLALLMLCCLPPSLLLLLSNSILRAVSTWVSVNPLHLITVIPGHPKANNHVTWSWCLIPPHVFTIFSQTPGQCLAIDDKQIAPHPKQSTRLLWHPWLPIWLDSVFWVSQNTMLWRQAAYSYPGAAKLTAAIQACIPQGWPTSSPDSSHLLLFPSSTLLTCWLLTFHKVITCLSLCALEGLTEPVFLRCVESLSSGPILCPMCMSWDLPSDPICKFLVLFKVSLILFIEMCGIIVLWTHPLSIFKVSLSLFLEMMWNSWPWANPLPTSLSNLSINQSINQSIHLNRSPL